MLELLSRDTEIVIILAFLSVLIILPAQLLLCFKAKSSLVKLLPTLVLAVTVLALYAVIFILRDRTAIGYGIMAIFVSVLLFFDELAWAIFGIVKLLKRGKGS